MAFGLIVDDLRVFFVGLVVVAAGGLLQFRNRIRRPHMLFAAVTPCVFAAGCQFFLQILLVAKGFGMHGNGFLRHFEQTQTADIGRCAFEVFIHQFLLQADCLENLRAGIRHIGGNTHFRHDFLQAFAHRFDEIFNRFGRFFVFNQTFLHHIGQGRERQIRMYRFRAKAAEQGKMMHFARAGRFYHQAGRSAQTLLHQVLVNRRGREQGRNR